MNDKSEITNLLQEWKNGSHSALEKLVPLVESELKKLAQSYIRKERKGHTLQPTALVNEAYIKLIDQQNVDWKSRSHFYAISATCMRRVLIDYAKARKREKRGGGAEHITFEDYHSLSKKESKELILLDEALKKLEEQEERKARVIELRYFGGLTIKETAEVLNISEKTVERDWNFARTWLMREIGSQKFEEED